MHNKGPQSIFDSPTKFKTPSQPSLFQQLSPSKISSPSRNDAPMFGKPAFTTPRKMDIDFSSGAENMSSPETADNEETPEPPRKREKRNSLWNLYGRFAPSPGRGEIPRPGHPPDTHARRIQKRRRRDREIDRHLRMELDSDYDSDRPSSSEWRFSRKPRLKKREQSQEQAPPQQQPPPSPWSLSSILGAIEAHPNVPRILSYWTQYFVNTLIFMLFTYVVWSFFATLRADISAGTKMKYDQIERKRNECATNYVANKCGADERLPALQQACKEWAECMSMDTSVARTLVGAETIGEVYTAFTNSISYKGFVGGQFISEIAFSSLTVRAGLFSFDHLYNHLRQQLRLPIIPRSTRASISTRPCSTPTLPSSRSVPTSTPTAILAATTTATIPANNLQSAP